MTFSCTWRIPNPTSNRCAPCARLDSSSSWRIVKLVIILFVHLVGRLAMLLSLGGVKAVLAENLLLKQQLLVLQRSRLRAPSLRPTERLLFGFWALFLNLRRLLRAAIVLKPTTLLRFHHGLRKLKYQLLYSSSAKAKPGPKGPAPELLQVICEFKRRNPRFGCPELPNTWPRPLV